MEEQAKTNPWGNEVKEESPAVTPKSNKYKYIFIALIVFLLLTMGGIVFVVYRSNIEVKPVVTSSNSSSTGSYETYSGKYVSFEYPTGSTVEDRQSGSGDIDLSIENELFNLALTGPARVVSS
jgi:flagellar basal body-associated protein FliL